MSENVPANTDLLYRLHDRPTPIKAFLGAIQHVLAAFVGIITPSLIIGGTLGLGEHIPYLLSMSLIVSGVATFIQTRKIGPIGSGLMALQGTSFGFFGGSIDSRICSKNRGGSPEEILSVIFGVSFLGAFVEIFLSQFITKLKSFMSPIVTGCVIVTIGLSLTKVGLTDLAGGFGAEDFGSIPNLLLGGGVLVSVVLISIINNKVVRSNAIFIGLMLGLLAAVFMGRIDFHWCLKRIFSPFPFPSNMVLVLIGRHLFPLPLCTLLPVSRPQAI